MLSRAKNCTVWAYDFSVVDFGNQLSDSNRGRAHFLQAGIAGKTDKSKSPPFYSIAELMRMNNHEYMYVVARGSPARLNEEILTHNCRAVTS